MHCGLFSLICNRRVATPNLSQPQSTNARRTTKALAKVYRNKSRLVKTDGLAHGGFDVKRLDVLPVLLQEGDEEVDAWKAMNQIFPYGERMKDILSMTLPRT